MNAKAKELDHWITSNGYGKLEIKLGSDHIRYRLRNGTALTASATPSKYTAITNGKSQVLRLLGIGSQSPAAGKIRHSPPKQQFKTQPFAGQLTSDIQDRIHVIDETLLRLDPRTNKYRIDALELCEERLQHVAELERRGMTPPPLPTKE